MVEGDSRELKHVVAMEEMYKALLHRLEVKSNIILTNLVIKKLLGTEYSWYRMDVFFLAPERLLVNGIFCCTILVGYSNLAYIYIYSTDRCLRSPRSGI